MIRLTQVSKVYDNNVTALSDINCFIDKGEFIFLVGPSGAGKSTLIKLLMCEERATSGKLMINQFDAVNIPHKQVPMLRRSLGVVFQDFRLLPKKTVFDNVAFALKIVEASRRQILRRVPECLDMVGLSHKGKAYPHELSGGERQRVSIARAICNNPAVLIADEPTGNLDPDTANDIMACFEKINSRGTTIIMATHAKEIVNQMAKRVIALEQGKLVRDQQRGEYGYGN
ncbi:MAG: cell division ATP-binding protein FtsE [Hyphomonadaceae bacterium]|nr:cell division ATP-binding protein FtsE [Clostridia bacterium]